MLKAKEAFHMGKNKNINSVEGRLKEKGAHVESSLHTKEEPRKKSSKIISQVR